MQRLYDKVFENNRDWVKRSTDEDPNFFLKLSQEQHPDFLWIGCSDSRVPANQIMGLQPGEVFVHRNIANIIPNTDINVHSVIQYAVTVLEVKHVIVCGHYGCGGVKAAMQSKDLGKINMWLRNIRDVYRLHYDELEAIEDMNARTNRLVELNVQEQAINVIKTSFVQKSFIEKGFPLVHGWVYDIGNGLLKDLKIDFEKVLQNIQKIYRIA
ncbi:MAG TPA: carbonic anhydrase [Saprospiraceae bacterium]|nr:carbonic anhydrase [Saprospiraceae bacterium]HMP24379.1 carbonic anhydrase [Saprospiraceae bacterium]